MPRRAPLGASHGVVVLVALTAAGLIGSVSAEYPWCEVVIALTTPPGPTTQVLPLNLMEVKLFESNGAEMAPDPARTVLSSTWPGLPASNCIDGNLTTMCATGPNDRNPSLRIRYNCSLVRADRIEVTNRPNAATGRCADCGDRINQFSVWHFNATGVSVDPRLPIPFSLFSVGGRGQDHYTAWIDHGMCWWEVFRRTPVPFPALPLVINLVEFSILQFSQFYPGQRLMVGMSSVLAPARLYGPASLVDNRTTTFVSTNLTDPDPWVRVGWPCMAGPVLTITNRLNSSPGCTNCMDRITNFGLRYCPNNGGACLFQLDFPDFFTPARPIYAGAP